MRCGNRAKKDNGRQCAEYKEKTDPYIYEDGKIRTIKSKRHKDAQLTIFDLGIPGMERKKSEKEREIEAIFTTLWIGKRIPLEIDKKSIYSKLSQLYTGVR